MKIQETKDGANIQGLTSIDVRSVREAADLVMEGLRNRSMAPTLMNITSSRAHTVLALEITKRYSNRTVCSKLRLVDLAGSERVNRTQSSGARLNEAKQINKSLSVLGNVISGLIKKGADQQHIPYRDSKLTRILKDVLQGNSNMTLIATLSPTKPSFYETMSTLVFAQRCMKVQTSAQINEKYDAIDYKSLAQQLQNQVMVLQKQSDVLGGAGGVGGSGTSNQTSGMGGGAYGGHGGGSQPSDDIAWSLVDALYETLWEVYEMSLYSTQRTVERTEQMDASWHELIEKEKLSSASCVEKLGLINQLYPARIVHYDAKGGAGDVLARDALDKKPMNQSENLEEFVTHVASIHRHSLGNILSISKNLEMRDHQLEDIKRNQLFPIYRTKSASLNGTVGMVDDGSGAGDLVSHRDSRSSILLRSQSNIEIAIYLQRAATKIQRLYRRYRSRKSCSNDKGKHTITTVTSSSGRGSDDNDHGINSNSNSSNSGSRVVRHHRHHHHEHSHHSHVSLAQVSNSRPSTSTINHANRNNSNVTATSSGRYAVPQQTAIISPRPSSSSLSLHHTTTTTTKTETDADTSVTNLSLSLSDDTDFSSDDDEDDPFDDDSSSSHMTMTQLDRFVQQKRKLTR